MVSDAESGRGHCKDVAHVRVEVGAPGTGYGKGYTDATYVPTTSCVNVPGYDGWIVQLFMGADTDRPRPSLRLLPELAETLPIWLRRAARAADGGVGTVVVQHTNDKVWLNAVILSPAGARWLAKSVLRAVELAPPGAHG